MTSFLRFSQKKDIQYFGPADPGTVGWGRKRFHPLDSATGRRRLHLDRDPDVACLRCASVSITLLGGKVPPYLGGPDIAQEFGIKGLALRA